MQAMYRVTAPVAGYTGTVAGVDLVDGQAVTSDPGAVAYFRRHGYTVEPVDQVPAEPAEPARGRRSARRRPAHTSTDQ